jgi:hypothetical protein
VVAETVVAPCDLPHLPMTLQPVTVSLAWSRQILPCFKAVVLYAFAFTPAWSMLPLSCRRLVRLWPEYDAVLKNKVYAVRATARVRG